VFTVQEGIQTVTRWSTRDSAAPDGLGPTRVSNLGVCPKLAPKTAADSQSTSLQIKGTLYSSIRWPKTPSPRLQTFAPGFNVLARYDLIKALLVTGT